ncbi:tyrosine-type recombinase/integrase [Pseudomonas sp. NPDC086278]|uniref:tyrosine-type recombinase/integrase n=1 Tax=Pseudomonas sp. NPDC086278 TaxID=3390646 RepID=UPI003D0540ED
MRKSKIGHGLKQSKPKAATKKQSAPGISIVSMNSLTLIKSEPPRLYENATGAPLGFYNDFCEHLWGEIGLRYKRNSVLGMEKGGRFFAEFLYETGALSGRLDSATASKTMHLFSSYLVKGDEAKDAIVRQAFLRTGRTKISASSAGQYIAGANLMLTVCSEITFEQAEMISVLTDLKPQVPMSALPELKPRVRSSQEMAQIHANTLQVKPNLSPAAKTSSGGLRPPKADKTRTTKHIGISHILPMLEHAPTPVDGLIWAMGLGSLRLSESVGVRLEDIDVTNRILRVQDPHGLRDTTNKESFGFKGRKTAVVTMFEPFKSRFWEKLGEYMAVRPHSDSPWLLLSLDAETYGMPLCELKSSSVNRAINRRIQATQRKLDLQAPQGNYSSHDFRHSFGIWARNYVTIPGRPKPGLDLPEIQLLMGHASLQSTEIYASDLGIHTLVEVDASNELIYDLGAGKDINFYRGQAYARLGKELLNKGPLA